ncbi:MAG TPA: hypothetical protein VHD91_02075, partial [Gaiellaceae bacterium]|nr:hypothetical protein [Gaiellaceae bacterium]
MKVMNLDAVATRRLVFAYDVAWFTGLGVLAFVYFKTGVRAWVPTELKPIPVYSAWFGALGSVAIGFHGVFEHGAVDKHGNSLWSGRWPLWYAGRPFSGM